MKYMGFCQPLTSWASPRRNTNNNSIHFRMHPINLRQMFRLSSLHFHQQMLLSDETCGRCSRVEMHHCEHLNFLNLLNMIVGNPLFGMFIQIMFGTLFGIPEANCMVFSRFSHDLPIFVWFSHRTLAENLQPACGHFIKAQIPSLCAVPPGSKSGRRF